MSRNTKTVLILLLLLVNPITGWVLGSLIKNGAFVQWKSLGSPPEKPVRFLAGYVGNYPGGSVYKGRETKVFVETIKGNVYQCCTTSSPSWFATKPENIEEVNWLDCLMGKEDENRRHLKGEIDNYAIYWCGEWDGGEAYYSINKDGSVWVWKNYGRFPDFVIPICGPPVIGFIIAIIIGFILLVANHRQKVQR